MLGLLHTPHRAFLRLMMTSITALAFSSSIGRLRYAGEQDVAFRIAHLWMLAVVLAYTSSLELGESPSCLPILHTLYVSFAASLRRGYVGIAMSTTHAYTCIVPESMFPNLQCLPQTLAIVLHCERSSIATPQRVRCRASVLTL